MLAVPAALARVAGVTRAAGTGGPATAAGVLDGAAPALAVGTTTGRLTVPGTTGRFSLGTAAGALGVLRAAALALALGTTRTLALGTTGALGVAAAAGAPALGAHVLLRRPRPARALGPRVVTPEAVPGLRSSAPSGTLGAVGPAPSTAAAWTVDRALGPATAAVGVPSSFGTHVVLDCLSRPVGLTIPGWKRGDGPPGGSVIRDLFSR